VLLAGETGAPGRERLARVLQQQPLDRDRLHAGTALAAAHGTQLDEELAGAVLRQDAQRLPRLLARVELHAERAEAPCAQLGQDAGPLEEELDAVREK
jgi:hypothetical protein